MKVSANGLAIIKAFEGCHKAIPSKPGYFKAYLDPVGVWTIGYGHTNHHEPKFNSSEVWSQAQCDAALASDLGAFERRVDKLATVRLTQEQFDALVSWAFNTGGPSTAGVWRSVNAKRFGDVPAELRKWNKGGGKVLNGLVRRRDAEAALFAGDVAGAFRIAGVKRPTLPDIPPDIVPRPPDIEPTDDPPPVHVPIWKRFWTWVTGTGVAGAGAVGFMDWRALLVLLGFVLVAVTLIVLFMGPDRVRSWIRKQVNR